MTLEVIQHVKVLSLNNSRIEALVEQLYMINKRLLMLENQIWRMADKSGVDREEFLKHYQGNEYESGWTRRVSRLTGKGWKNFITDNRVEVNAHRDEIQQLAETGLILQIFVVLFVKFGEREARIAKRNGRSQFTTRNLNCQKIHQSRFAIPGFDSGRKYHLDESRR